MTTLDDVIEHSQPLVESLGARLRVEFDEDAGAQLALLQVMPFDEDAVPLALCNAVLERNPRHGLANLVRSYLSLHYLMDDDDHRVVADRLKTLIGAGIAVGAASLQLDEIQRVLKPDAGYPATEALIRQSIEAAPTWTLNHLRSARGLRDARRVGEARAEYGLALANLIEHERDMAPLDWSFAACFTGQLMRRDYLEAERDKPY